MDWLAELLRTQLQPQLAHLWGSLDVWRNLALGLMTLLAALAAFRKPLLRRLTHRGLAPRDRELFARLLGVLPSEGIIAFLEELDFGRAFDRRRLDPLDNFCDDWDTPGHRFLDDALEEKRMELFVAVLQFMDAVRSHTARDEAGLQSVMRGNGNGDADADLPERTRDALRVLSGAAKSVVGIHRDIVRLGSGQDGFRAR